MANAQVTCIGNQKGGVGKTTTTESLAVALSKAGKRVLVVDLDPQASLTIAMGNPLPDELDTTVTDIMRDVIDGKEIQKGCGILHHEEDIDLLPANIELAGMEASLVNVMSRETILKEYLSTVRKDYDHILIDCMPSLGMLTINALTAADSILIPMQPQYLSAKGLEQLLSTVNKVKRQLNPKLRIEGILLTMVDGRTNNAKEIAELVRNIYGKKIPVFGTEIPRSVRVAETPAEGKSIFAYDPKGKATAAYDQLAKEVMHNAQIRRKHQLAESR
ncbi:ParA family protein [Bacillota bacterium LCP21S3_D8]